MTPTRVTALVALLLGAFALWHAFVFMGTFDALRPAAIAPERLPPVPHIAPVAGERRVVLALVDGLRADRQDALQLDAGGHRHTTCNLTAQLPSFSRPNYVALLTGTPPALSGVRTNDHAGPVGLLSVFDIARTAGWITAVISDYLDPWPDLFPAAFGSALDPTAPAPGAITTAPTTTAPEDLPAWVTRWPGPPAGSLTLLHFDSADDIAHKRGVGPAYDAEVARIGAALAVLLTRLDPTRDTLFVASDHGHISRGGHGGPEPEVLATRLGVYGAAAAPTPLGARCDSANVDLAPTLSAALELPPPPASFGRPITAVLDVTRVDVALVDAQRGALARALGAPAGDLDRLPDGVRQPAIGPIALAAGAWLLFVFALHRLTRRARVVDTAAWPFVLRGAAYPLAVIFLHRLVEPSVSFSSVWLEGPWTRHIVFLIVAGAALGAFATWPLAGRLRGRPERAAGWVLAFSLLPFLAAAGWHGALFAGPVLGDPHAAFTLQLSGVVLAVGAVTALLMLGFDRLRGVHGSMQVSAF